MKKGALLAWQRPLVVAPYTPPAGRGAEEALSWSRGAGAPGVPPAESAAAAWRTGLPAGGGNGCLLPTHAQGALYWLPWK